ncbi:auxin-responsive protein SAUR32-like [Actinidia eriantha]|uniref:auxin-responsive protein SAUR32-like n=1 Tax=Actinidia eriantha TaxID=165200 RepID=UPI0025866451|nr:auxin-responsive protein SAUR32-like [Actinidia eriantha]
MGSGDRVFLNFHLHVPHLHLHHHHGGKREEEREIPRGCVAVVVGQGEEQQRVIVPVIYINHPLFIKLLKEAEEEYGFDQKGPINIPCHVEEFRYVKDIIDKEESLHHHHHHHHHHPLLCFRV